MLVTSLKKRKIRTPVRLISEYPFYDDVSIPRLFETYPVSEPGSGRRVGYAIFTVQF